MSVRRATALTLAALGGVLAVAPSSALAAVLYFWTMSSIAANSFCKFVLYAATRACVAASSSWICFVSVP